ncbi:hypothetical protein SNK03_007358 [Fusarium graminearum]
MCIRDTYYPLLIACLVVSGIAVGLRLWVRIVKKAIGYDDVVMLLSLTGFIIFCAMELQAIRYGVGATVMEDGFDPTKAAIFFTIAQIAYILTTGLSKLGVGLVLFRLASGANMRGVRIILIISMIIVTLWFLVITLIFGFQCRPLSVGWGVGEGACLSTSALGTTGLALSGMDVIVSWFYALLSVCMLYKTQLRLKIKIMIMVLLGLGAVSSIAIIVRIKYLVDSSRLTWASESLTTQDSVEITLEGTVYSILEIALSILAASLTALRPLLMKIPGLRGDPSRRVGLGSVITFGHGGDRKIPSYCLDDRDISVIDSQEHIVPERPLTSG